MTVINSEYLPTLYGDWRWKIWLDTEAMINIQIIHNYSECFHRSFPIPLNAMASEDALVNFIRSKALPMSKMYGPWNPYAAKLLRGAINRLIPPKDNR